MSRPHDVYYKGINPVSILNRGKLISNAPIRSQTRLREILLRMKRGHTHLALIVWDEISTYGDKSCAGSYTSTTPRPLGKQCSLPDDSLLSAHDNVRLALPVDVIRSTCRDGQSDCSYSCQDH